MPKMRRLNTTMQEYYKFREQIFGIIEFTLKIGISVFLEKEEYSL
jgi:hypothetical protein